MPTYFYSCPKCENVREDDARMSEFKDHHPPCEDPECDGICNYVYIPTVPQVAFKDGPSGSWPSKGNHFKEFRRKQAEKMEKRQKDRYGHIGTGAVPNYNGKETGTWAEAQFQAMKDKGADSAATFNDKVKKERSTVKKGKIIT